MSANQQSVEEIQIPISKLVSMVIRNAMEDFRIKHLSDEQMAELNPTIRNAVYTALHSIHTMKDNENVLKFVELHSKSIPSYWEEPTLLDDYAQLIR